MKTYGRHLCTDIYRYDSMPDSSRWGLFGVTAGWLYQGFYMAFYQINY